MFPFVVWVIEIQVNNVFFFKLIRFVSGWQVLEDPQISKWSKDGSLNILEKPNAKRIYMFTTTLFLLLFLEQMVFFFFCFVSFWALNESPSIRKTFFLPQNLIRNIMIREIIGVVVISGTGTIAVGYNEEGFCFLFFFFRSFFFCKRVAF